jgi:hypothetical protein
MPIIASAASGADFAPAPSGPQHAVCSAVFDMGEEYSELYKKLSHKICVFWELSEKLQDGRPFMLSKQYTLSLGDKANLRKDIECWRGKPFTSEELAGFDVERLIGANVMLNVIHSTKDGKTRAQVAGLMPPMKGLPKLTVTSTEVPKWAHERKAKNLAAASLHKAEAAQTAEDDHPEPIKPGAAGGAPVEDLPFLPLGYWG